MGRVIEILGHPDDFGIDVEIVIRKHHLPHQFPAGSDGAGAERFRTTITARRTRRAGAISATCDIVTIDGETARDFDDAVWVERLPNGNYALQVHIADVSHYVRPGYADRSRSAAARHQRLLSRTAPCRCCRSSFRPNICSLKPQADRLVLSALIEIDHQRRRRWRRSSCRGVIRSAERMTYTNVHLLLEGDAAHARALRAAGGALRADAGTGADSEPQARAGAARSISICPSR